MANKSRRGKLDSVLAGEPEMITVNPGSGLANKMAADFSGGVEPLPEFISIPINLLEPYSRKKGSDFSRNPVLHAQMVASIRENGVLEPLTVRKKDQRHFEILAGETRWLAAKEAELKRVPCRLVDADDFKADQIFSITNLYRRDLTVRDRINGWWLFYNSLKENGKLQAFRENANDPEFSEIVSSEGAGKFTFRHIQRYVKCHDLIDAWLDRLDADAVNFVTACRIAFFPSEVQELLLKYPVEEKKVETLYKIYDGKVPDVTWKGEETIAEILGGTVQVVVPKKPSDTSKKMFSRSTKIMLCKTVRNEIRDEDFDRVETIVREALKMYYDMQDKMSKK